MFFRSRRDADCCSQLLRIIVKSVKKSKGEKNIEYDPYTSVKNGHTYRILLRGVGIKGAKKENPYGKQ